jgi:spoIIIJ-associated protein
MENSNNQAEKALRAVIEEVMSKMGFAMDVEVKTIDEKGKETIVCNIKTEESNFLIGQYGVNLQSLQHIIRLIARKKVSDKTNFILDVNSYRQEKNESIVKLAKTLASEAVSERRAVVMRPMSPYERRIVHMELAKNDAIRTESIGEGDDRRVVIKPTDLI